MISKILSEPLRQRQYRDYWGNLEIQQEILVLLEDGTECTVWIPISEMRKFVNEYTKQK